MIEIKRLCKYCNEKIEYKKDEIIHDEDNGRGIYCPLCGSLISIPKKVINTSFDRSYSSYARRRHRTSLRTLSTTQKIIFIVGFIIIQIPIIWYFSTQIWPGG